MSPRIRKTKIDSYRPVLSIEDRDNLTALAGRLGFIVSRKGTYEGLPSVTDFLHKLAVAYEADPEGIYYAMKVNGVTNKPTPPDADE